MNKTSARRAEREDLAFMSIATQCNFHTDKFFYSRQADKLIIQTSSFIDDIVLISNGSYFIQNLFNIIHFPQQHITLLPLVLHHLQYALVKKQLYFLSTMTNVIYGK